MRKENETLEIRALALIEHTGLQIRQKGFGVLYMTKTIRNDVWKDHD